MHGRNDWPHVVRDVILVLGCFTVILVSPENATAMAALLGTVTGYWYGRRANGNDYSEGGAR